VDSLSPDVLGHLRHHVQPQCAEELWMVVREVTLRRSEELFSATARELRPESQ